MRKTSQAEDKKMLSTKKLVDAGLVISLLLLATLIARVILYSLVTARAQLTQEKLAQLESNLSLARKYLGCKERTSGTDCGQFFYKDCPINWRLHKETCYFFSQTPLSWEVSRSVCQSSQADLVIIADREEQLFIRNTNKAGFYWIGLTDKDKEGTWKWVNGSKVQPETFWNCNQPDNTGREEHCATVGSNSVCGYVMDWNDDNCEKAHNFICEKEAEDRKMDFNP